MNIIKNRVRSELKTFLFLYTKRFIFKETNKAYRIFPKRNFHEYLS